MWKLVLSRDAAKIFNLNFEALPQYLVEAWIDLITQNNFRNSLYNIVLIHRHYHNLIITVIICHKH